MGTLRLEVGKIDEAKEAFTQSIDICDKMIAHFTENSESKMKYQAIRITGLFNLGYWHEKQHSIREASELYKQILRDEPTYLDAYLRLAFLAREKGHHDRAFELLENAKKNVFKQHPVY